jgi:hypothetical protein
MTRINVYSVADESDRMNEDGPQLLGWFDSSKSSRWTDRDYNGNGSGGTGRGQAVNRTAQGKWVLEHWTCWVNEHDRYEYITPDAARECLLRNQEDEAAAKYFGDLAEEEDRRPGRPEIGEPVNVRLGSDLLAMVDAYASERSISRAEALRRLVTDAVTRSRVNG